MLYEVITTTGQGGETRYNMFFGPADHVEELLTAGKIAEASQVYNGNVQAFGPKDQPTLDRLAAAVQGIAQPKIATALAEVRASSWPVPAGQWAEVKKALLDAREAEAFATGQAVLGLPGKAPAGLDALRAEHAKLEAAVDRGAREAFAAYPIFGGVHFFREYPAALNPEVFLNQNQDLLWDKLSKGTPSEIAALFNSYRNNFV